MNNLIPIIVACCLICQWCFENVLSTQPLCLDSFSCALQNITFSSTGISGGYLRCYGAYGCAYARNIEFANVANETGVIHCYGDHACYGSKSVKIQGYLECIGLKSCGFIDLLFHSHGTIVCRGAKACIKSNITVTNGYLYCDSGQSCSESNITTFGNTVELILDGSYAVSNATIRVMSDFTRVHFRGSNSGYQTRLIWQPDGTGDIDCLTGNACTNLTLECSVPGACNFDGILSCRYADNSDLCPRGETRGVFINKEYDSTYFVPVQPFIFENLIMNDTSTSTNNFLSFDCNSYRSCFSYTLLVNHNENPIVYLNISNNSFAAITMPLYCGGYEACFFTNVVIDGNYLDDNGTDYNNTINNTNNNGYNNYSIRCDGGASCLGVSDSIVIKNNHGNMYFSGYFSLGHGRTINSRIRVENVYNYNYSNGCMESSSDVFCGGYTSCEYSILNCARTVYCDGPVSCLYTIISNVQTVWVTGYYGASDTIFYNVSSNVYCMSFDSCYQAVFNNIGGYIHGVSLDSLQKAEFRNIYGVVCRGRRACQETIINNVEFVEARGEYSLASSVIIFVLCFLCGCFCSVLHCFLTVAIVVSNRSGGIMTFEAYNTAADDNNGMDIYCSENDECRIGCYSEFGCTNIRLHCFGTCLVSCNQVNNIDCPYIEEGFWIDWITDTTLNNISNINNNNTDSNSDENSSTGSQSNQQDEIYRAIIDGFVATTGIAGIIALIVTCTKQYLRLRSHSKSINAKHQSCQSQSIAGENGTGIDLQETNRVDIKRIELTTDVATPTTDINTINDNKNSLSPRVVRSQSTSLIASGSRTPSHQEFDSRQDQDQDISGDLWDVGVGVDTVRSVSGTGTTSTTNDTKTDRGEIGSKNLKQKFESSILLYFLNIHFAIMLFTILLCVFMSFVCAFYGYGQITQLNLGNYSCDKKSLADIYEHSEKYQLNHGTNDGCWKSKQFTVKTGCLCKKVKKEKFFRPVTMSKFVAL